MTSSLDVSGHTCHPTKKVDYWNILLEQILIFTFFRSAYFHFHSVFSEQLGSLFACQTQKTSVMTPMSGRMDYSAYTHALCLPSVYLIDTVSTISIKPAMCRYAALRPWSLLQQLPYLSCWKRTAAWRQWLKIFLLLMGCDHFKLFKGNSCLALFPSLEKSIK